MTKDIAFYIDSIKFFAKLKADYMFSDSDLRRKIEEIILYHKAGQTQSQEKIKFYQQIIKKIDTPLITPDGETVTGA